MDPLFPYVFPLAVALSIFAFIYYSKKNKATLEQLCREIGATEPSSKWFPPSTRALWRGRGIVLRLSKLGKRGPYVAIVDISAACPARAIVRRSGWLNVVVLFGPPRVEIPGLVDYSVRSDDIMLAQKIFSDAQLSSLIASTMIDQHDVLELTANRIRVRRTAYGGSDEHKLEAARQAWPLAAAVVERLGIPPAG